MTSWASCLHLHGKHALCSAGVYNHPETCQGSCGEAPCSKASHSCHLHPMPLEASPSRCSLQLSVLSKLVLASLGQALGRQTAIQAHKGSCHHSAGMLPCADVMCFAGSGFGGQGFKCSHISIDCRLCLASASGVSRGGKEEIGRICRVLEGTKGG